MVPQRESGLQTSLVGVFAFLLLGIGAANFFFYRAESTASRDQTMAQLAAIADLKAQQIDNWRRERLGDAGAVHDNPLIASAMTRWLSGRLSTADQSELQRWLSLFVANYDYRDAALLDSAGHLVAATRSGMPLPEDIASLRKAVTQSGAPGFGNLHTLPDGEHALDMLTPIPGTKAGGTLGFLLLRVAPEKVLYPTLKAWPLPSDSAEILLVERRGDRIVYLNDLRHQAGAALSLSIAADTLTLPATYAVRGETRSLEGRDYRGIAVYAATRPVPGTTWALVAKIDEREVLRPLHERIGLMIFVSVFLVMVASGIALFLWQAQRDLIRRQRERDMESRAELQKSKERLTEAQRIGRIGSWERDLTTGDLWWSEEAYRLFGYTRKEQAAPTVELFFERVHPDDRADFRKTLRKATETGEPYSVDYRVLLPGEAERYYQNVGQILRGADGQPVRATGTVQDITLHKRSAEELERRHALLKTIIENIPGAVSLLDGQLNFIAFNQEFGRLLDFQIGRAHV